MSDPFTEAESNKQELERLSEVIGAGSEKSETNGKTAPKRFKGISKRLSSNVERNLNEGKDSLYLTLKAHAAYKLNPSPETAEMAAQANFRYYDKGGKYEDFRNYLSRLFVQARNDELNAHVNVLRNETQKRTRDGNPSANTVKIAKLRLNFDSEEQFGAAYDTAIACGQLFEATGNTKLLEDAVGYAKDASIRSEGKIEWVEGVKDWTLRMLRDEVVKRNGSDYKGSEESVDLAKYRVVVDGAEDVGALHDAALAHVKFYLDAERPDGMYLDQARDYIQAASTISEGKIEWVEGVKNWITSIEKRDVL